MRAAGALQGPRCLVAALLGMQLLATAAAADRTGEHATPSPRAARSLLLDVARAGDRIVAVGEWGYVVLSDDGGVTWRQAREVPTRVTLTGVYFVDARRGSPCRAFPTRGC